MALIKFRTFLIKKTRMRTKEILDIFFDHNLIALDTNIRIKLIKFIVAFLEKSFEL